LLDCGVLSSSPILAVFASGQGTNFEALAAAAEAEELGGELRALFSDRADAPAIERARRRGIETVTPPVGRFRTRLEDESPWLTALRERRVEVILLAGFMRRLHEILLDAYPDRVLNIHPSLLPRFPGLDAIGQAWRHGALATGCTVHLVDEGLDSGPILAQASVGVREEDDLASLETRIHRVEHLLYPRTVRRYLTEPWRREGARIAWGEGAGFRSLAPVKWPVRGVAN